MDFERGFNVMQVGQFLKSIATACFLCEQISGTCPAGRSLELFLCFQPLFSKESRLIQIIGFSDAL
jgi:hypothetical protein